jgi:transposase-like protein
VRWYLRYKLSLRDLVEMMAERGLSLAHTTIPTTDHRIIGITRKPAEEIASLAAPTM